MSHKANAWLALLDPKLVKMGAFRILFHLCDFHNADNNPMAACYPSQETLMGRTGLSNGALNNALNEMEKDGLIMRRRSTVPGTSERRTYYILGCDFDLIAKQTPEYGVSSNSSPLEPAKEQTPVLGGANSILRPSKLQPTGEEPLRTTLGTSSRASAREGGGDFQKIISKIATAVGRDPANLPSDWTDCRAKKLVSSWLDRGLSPEQIVEAARTSRNVHPTAPDRLKALDGFMSPDRVQPSHDDRAKTKAENLDLIAEKLKNKQFVPPSVLTDEIISELVSSGRVPAGMLAAR